MSAIPNGISKQDVLDAIKAMDRGEPHDFGDSTGYDLVYGGHDYAPKAVLGLATRRILGTPLGPYDFKGGEGSQCFRVLRDLGFVIESKIRPTGAGTDWQEHEIRALVEDYFAMLALERRGEPYRKAERVHALTARLPGRTSGAIEYKHQNVSGVLYDEGFPYIDGFKPARNYQTGQFPQVVLEFLYSEDPEVQQIAASMDIAAPKIAPAGAAELREVPAPEHDETAPSPPDRTNRYTHKYNFPARDAANRTLGRAGEELVLALERALLMSSGREDLATRVEWVSETRGDGLGYDIASFDPRTGEPACIEVKTTNGNRDTRFFVSANELLCSAALGSRYRLYRVFNFSTAPQFYRISGDLNLALHLTPKTYEARR